MNIRGADIIEKVAKRRGRPAAKKQVEEKMAESMQAIANDCGLKA